MRFATLFFGLLLPLVAAAQAPVILVEGSVPQYRRALAGVKRALAGAEEVSPTAPELPSRLQDASVIVAVGQASLDAAARAAPGKPVVYCMVLASSGEGGHNVTGVPLETDPAAVLAHIKSLSPKTKKVGVILNRAHSVQLLRDAHAAAGKLGMELVVASVTRADQVQAISRAVLRRIDALWLPPDPRLFNREVFNYLLSASSERNVPLVGFLDSFTEAGALASVSPDYEDIGARAGRLAAQIASRPPEARLPVPDRVYSPGKLTINLRTAEALGISVSDAATAKARQVFR